MKNLKLSRKIGIATLIALVTILPLSVLATNGNGEPSAAKEGCRKPFWGFRRAMRGLCNGDGEFLEALAEKLGVSEEDVQDAALEVMVDKMAEELELTEEEIEQVTPIIQDICDLREQLKTKHEELDAIIGDKLEEYRESRIDEGCGGLRRGIRRRPKRWLRRGPPIEDAPEESE